MRGLAFYTKVANNYVIWDIIKVKLRVFVFRICFLVSLSSIFQFFYLIFFVAIIRIDSSCTGLTHFFFSHWSFFISSRGWKVKNTKQKFARVARDRCRCTFICFSSIRRNSHIFCKSVEEAQKVLLRSRHSSLHSSFTIAVDLFFNSAEIDLLHKSNYLYRKLFQK